MELELQVIHKSFFLPPSSSIRLIHSISLPSKINEKHGEKRERKKDRKYRAYNIEIAAMQWKKTGKITFFGFEI